VGEDDPELVTAKEGMFLGQGEAPPSAGFPFSSAPLPAGLGEWAVVEEVVNGLKFIAVVAVVRDAIPAGSGRVLPEEQGAASEKPPQVLPAIGHFGGPAFLVDGVPVWRQEGWGSEVQRPDRLSFGVCRQGLGQLSPHISARAYGRLQVVRANAHVGWR